MRENPSLSRHEPLICQLVISCNWGSTDALWFLINNVTLYFSLWNCHLSHCIHTVFINSQTFHMWRLVGEVQPFKQATLITSECHLPTSLFYPLSPPLHCSQCILSPSCFSSVVSRTLFSALSLSSLLFTVSQLSPLHFVQLSRRWHEPCSFKTPQIYGWGLNYLWSEIVFPVVFGFCLLPCDFTNTMPRK